MTFFSHPVGDRAIPVEIRRRKGTRHLRLRLGQQNQIVASVPWHCGDKEVARFIEANRAWLERQLNDSPPPQSVAEWLAAHPLLTASGDIFRVRVETVDASRSGYVFDNGGADIVLQVPVAAERNSALTALVRRFAKDALACRVAYQAKRLDLTYAKLSVRDQATRWGSCSSSRSISLNWRLVLVPPALQDYVILHELAHLTEMNHSRRFWTLLDAYLPNRAELESDLDAVTAKIMRVGRGS